MADFSALKTSIQNYIKQNGNEEITGNLLQQILLSMVTTLGDSAINDLVTALNAEIANRGNADTELGGSITTLQGVVNGIVANIQNGYVYAGIATPSSTPASGKVFYLALTAGTYTNFGATVVPQGINILKYNGSAWSLDSFLGLDDAPTQGSSNFVKSGGVLDSIIKDGSAFDLSAYNNGTTYADLNAALIALNALPAAYKKGGMSFKYVQTSDNKYVQSRCIADEFTTDVTQWQGVDDRPTAGSKNLVESGGVSKEIDNLKIGIYGVINNRLFITGNTKVYIKMKAGVSYTFTLSIDEAKSFAIYNQLYGNGALIVGLTIQAGNTSYSYMYTPQTDIDDAYIYIPSSISGNYMNVSVAASKSVVQRLDSLDEAIAAETLARTNKDTELSNSIKETDGLVEYINGIKYLTGSTTTRYSEKIINMPVYEGDTLEISDFTSQLSIRQISVFGDGSTLLGTSSTGNIKIVIASNYGYIRVVVDFSSNVTSTYSYTYKISSHNNINGIYNEIDFVDKKFDVVTETLNFNLVDGYILGTNGTLQPSEIFISTDFIDISKAISGYISFNGVVSGSAGFSFYDKNKNFIFGVNSYNASTYGITPSIEIQKIRFEIPNNACYFRTCIIKAQNTTADDFDIFFYFGRNTVNKECEIIRPFYEVYYPQALGWSDFFINDGYLYAFKPSSDNHSNYNYINIVRLQDMTLVKTLKHNLGHCNTVHYRNNKVIIGNLPGYTDHLAEIYILYGIDNWLTYEDNTKIEYSSATVINLSNSPVQGGQIACCFGENNLELDNIVYISAGFNKNVYRVLLGMGTNQLDYGTYTASDNDKYNGTFKVINSYQIVLDTNDDNEEVIQGIDYYNGHILTANGHTGGKAFLWDIYSNNFISRKKILIEPLDENGDLYESYTEGLSVDENGTIYQGIFRWNEDVPQKVNCLVSYKL